MAKSMYHIASFKLTVIGLMREYAVFTSESVSEGHPDKMADQISDAILDAILKEDPYARVACETLVKTGAVVLATRAYGSSFKIASKIASLIWSAILSGWPSLTDSEVNTAYSRISPITVNLKDAIWYIDLAI